MKICQDTFTIRLLLFVDCHLTIDAADKEKAFVLTKGGNYPFTVTYTYIVGTDYDVSHANFGFSAEYPAASDPKNVLSNGVSISNEAFTPATPDVTGLPNAIKPGTYAAVLNISNDETIFNSLLTLLSVVVPGGSRYTNPLFAGIIMYNQGI